MSEEFQGAIGIDLGTTYSCVAVFLNDRVEVIPNDMGNRVTPSTVAFHGDDVLVGDSAKNLMARGVPGVIFDAKRMIGRHYSDKELQQDSKRWPFSVSASTDGDDRVSIDVDFRGESLHLAPEQISARVLTYLKECAERHLGKRVTKAVITVPAYFNDAQRERTKAAATIAGLDALRVVNEPTAAALCYGLGIGSGSGEAQGNDAPKNVVVFDLGGGTFDVSVITIDSGSFAVRATAGDTHLGGQDVDAKLMEYVLDDLRKRHNVDISEQPRQLAKVRAACERVKRSLSHSTAEELAVDGVLTNGDEYTLGLSRAKLEELNSAMFDTCLSVVKKALKDAGMSAEEIDEVILVGGSSRIAKLQSLLSDFFGGKKLCNSVHPDEAVAIGAAIQASILSTLPEQQSERTAAVVLMDVVPLSIGVEIDNDKFDVVIPRNTTIPYKATKEYTTVKNNQAEVDILVFEGERPLTKHNHKLGEFTLEGITKAKKGEPTITVTFSVDANGLLCVTAEEELAKKSKSLVVQNDERLSEAQVQNMIEMAQKLRKQDAVELAIVTTQSNLMAAFEKLEKAVAALPNPPSAKLQKRLSFVPQGKEWVEKQLPTYTDPSQAAEKEKKVTKLVAKALHKVAKEYKRQTQSSSQGDAPGHKRSRSQSGEAGGGSSSDSDAENE